MAEGGDPNLPANCRLNPHDEPGGLCVCGIDKRPLSAPTEETVPALMAADTGGKNTQEQLQSELPPQQVQRSAQCREAF